MGVQNRPEPQLAPSGILGGWDGCCDMTVTAVILYNCKV